MFKIFAVKELDIENLFHGQKKELYQAAGDDSRCEKAIDRYLQLPLTTTIP